MINRVGTALAILTSVGIVLIVGAALLLLRHPHDGAPGRAGGFAGTDPPAFAVVRLEIANGLRLELRSPETGRVVQSFGRIPGSFLAFGMALAPNARSVYLTFPSRDTMRIERLDFETHTRRTIANGDQPAISPNGRYLAYVQGGRPPSGTIAVKDLLTGGVRSARVSDLLGDRLDLADGSITWLNNREVAILPGSRPDAGPSASRLTSVSLMDGLLLVVDAPPVGRQLTAHRVRVQGLEAGMISGDLSHPGSLLVAAERWPSGDHSRVRVYRVTLSGTTPRVKTLGTFRDGQPLTFDPIGGHLLYTGLANPTGTAVPGLWDVTIGQDRLTGERLLMPEAALQAGAW